jgi:hypothetical protein
MFIHHTLMMLEDAGMRIKYPKIRHILLDKDGNGKLHEYHSLVQGRQVSVEQNPQMKFLMLFALLDLHVDASYPELEGKGYREKYDSLPAQGDYNLILRQLFRVAKVIRNALVHNQSSFVISDGQVSVDYTHGKHHFCLNISWEEFQDFQTAVVMYVRCDMGKGSYFMGIMRSVYASVLAGITKFNDEFGSALEQPTTGIKMIRHMRQIVMHPPYETCGDALRFPSAARKTPEWEGLDIYIVQSGEEFLVPREALDEDLSITKHDLITGWKREGHYPQVKVQ